MIFLAVLLIGLPLAFLIRSLTDEGWRPIVSVEVLEQRDVIYLSVVEVFVVHDDGGPVALSAISPSEDRVAYCRSSATFIDARGSSFDRMGRYIAGPAPWGLQRIAVRVRDGVVEVNPARVTRGPGRETEGSPPVQGGSCEPPGPDDRTGFAD